MDIENLSTRELAILKAHIEGMLEERDKRLNSYKYVAQSTTQINTDNVFKDISNHFSTHDSLSDTFFYMIVDANRNIIPRPVTMRYSCPYCGQFTLKAMQDIPENGINYYISCTNQDCDFLHDDADGSEIAAWKSFHMWLMVQGYLPIDTPFIEDI